MLWRACVRRAWRGVSSRTLLPKRPSLMHAMPRAALAPPITSLACLPCPPPTPSAVCEFPHVPASLKAQARGSTLSGNPVRAQVHGIEA